MYRSRRNRALICLASLLLSSILLTACTPGDNRPADTGDTVPASQPAASDTAGQPTEQPTDPSVEQPTEMTDGASTLPDTPGTEVPTEEDTEPAATVLFTDWPEEPAKQTAEPDYDATHAWVFSNPAHTARWSGSGATVGVEFGELTVRPTTHDPIVQITLRPDEYIDASEYRYVAYRYRARATLKSGVFFVGSTTHPTFSDSGLLFFKVDISDEWTDLIADITACPYWTDMITKFRIDPINGGTLDEGACIRIDRVGFFRSEEEARAFLDDAAGRVATGAQVLSGDTALAFLPDGAFVPGYERDAYLTDTVAAGDGAVTLDGRILPISYVNAVGYGFYFAPEPGEYVGVKLDTGDGSPLAFVQARGLLTGRAESDPLSREDTVNLVRGLCWSPDKTPDLSGITDGTVRELCAAFKSLCDLSGFEPYFSLIRLCPAPDDVYDGGIRFAWRTGLIDGADLLSPDAPLTAGKAADMTRRLILALLDLPVLPSAVDPDALPVGAWYSGPALDADIARQLTDAGINLLVSTGTLEGSTLSRTLKVADEFGIRILINNYAPGSFDPENPVSPLPASGAYYDLPSMLGNTIYDEPGSDRYPDVAALADYYEKVLPGKMPFFNLLPMYANAAQLKFGASADKIDYYDPDPDLYRKYVTAYAEQVGTDYICVDIYPNRSNGKAKTTYNGYLKNMDIFASVCKNYDRDFWLYIQTVGLDGVRVPDYNDMRLQMYVGLSFGVRSFIHFTYNTYEGQGWTVSMVGTDGKPTPVYDAAREANLEIKALSASYLTYRWDGAYTLNVKDNMPEAKLDNPYAGIGGLSIDTKLPLLVGCFSDPDGDGYAFTLVNMTQLSKRGSADVNFSLADTGKTVTVWQGGVPTVPEPSDGTYTVRLSLGEGVFVTVE